MTEIILCLISRFLEAVENRLTFGFLDGYYLVDDLPDILERRIRSAGQRTGCMSCQPHLVYKNTGQTGPDSFGYEIH